MTKLVEEAFSEVSKLPEKEQNAIAQWLLEELASERRWDKSFHASQRRLASLAKEAVSEHRSGLSKELDADKL